MITVLSTWTLLGSHFSAAFWLSAASMMQAIAVFALSIKWGYGGWEWLDIVCLIIALVGLVLWRTSGQPVIGLVAAITADVVGNIPMIVKTYKLPNTENWQFFAMDTFSGFLSLMAISSFTVYTASYPVYIVVINGIVATLVITRKRAVSGAN